jgi:hypothetical protein
MAAPIISCVRSVSRFEFVKMKITTELAEGSRNNGELAEAQSTHGIAEEERRVR